MSRTIHAGALALGEEGVLVRGAPGTGKSALARALVCEWTASGAFAALVADDRTVLCATGGALIARPPAPLRGKEEVRGIGILAVPFLPAVRLTLVIDLERLPERCPADADTCVDLGGVTLPRMVLPACSAEHSARTLRYVLTGGGLTPSSRETQRVAPNSTNVQGDPR